MLNRQERDIVEHLHDAGKGGVEITRVIENRRIKAFASNQDMLEEVFNEIARCIYFYEGGAGITKFRE